MTIQPLATSAPSQTSGTQTSGAGTSSPSTSPDNVNETQFLQLLVAQIQYQDPTNPTDSTTFVTQLAQFSSLEQLVGIHSDLNGLTQTTNNSTSPTQGGN